MSEITEQLFKKIYWKNFIAIEDEFIKINSYVTLDTINYKTYSTAFLKLLLEVGSEIDIVCKLLCSIQFGRTDVSNINAYRDCILANIPNFVEVSAVTEEIREIPWKNWLAESPKWWKVYNGVKHNRFAMTTIDGECQEFYKFANLENVMKSLMALYQLEVYVLNYLIKEEGKDEIFSFLKSGLFSLDGGGWSCSKFHGENDAVYTNNRLILPFAITNAED